jgi:hypothetical protein
MSLSAEFITATVFAVVMVLIGLGAIWIVRWQTYFLLRHQGESPDGSSYVCLESQERSPLRLIYLPSTSCIVTHLNQVMI